MRPDFGSGLLALVFEPGGPELVATTQHLVQGALQQELGNLIAVDSVEVAQDEGTLTVTVSYVALQTQRAAAGVVLEERAVSVTYAAATSAACARSRRPASSTGSSTSRSPTPRRRRRRCASARCFVRLLQPAPGAHRRQRRISGGERIRTVAVEWIAPATALPAGEDPALVAGLDDPATVLLVRTDCARRLLDVHAPPRRGRRQRRAAGRASTRCSSAVEFSFKVECPSDFDCAPRLRLPARAGRRAVDRLPRQGLRRVPPADARPAQPARAGAGPSGRPPTWASRSSSCSPTSPTSSRTARTRSRPRPTSAPRAGAPRCAATRGSSTTPCTRAGTPAPGCASSSDGEGVALDRAHAAADARARTCPT